MGAEILRVFLIIDMAALALLAAAYLAQRRLSAREYVLWGLLALLPVIGPFLVVASRPGVWRAGATGLAGRLPSLAGRIEFHHRIFALPGPRRRRLVRRAADEEQDE